MLRAPAGTLSPREQPAPADGKSIVLHLDQVEHNALVSFVPLALIKENTGLPRLLHGIAVTEARPLGRNRFCSPQESAPSTQPMALPAKDAINSHREYSGSPITH
ncbi:unnamed protein product [Coccothraustes coccothraustes]